MAKTTLTLLQHIPTKEKTKSTRSGREKKENKQQSYQNFLKKIQ